jgi:hypothetical protein
MVVRKPTFLNEEAWKTIPWSAGTSTKDILHHLLDLIGGNPCPARRGRQLDDDEH